MEFKIYFIISLFIFTNGYGLPNSNNNGRHRRRPQIDQTAYYDQSAHATTGLWPDNRNLITSASHTQVYQLDEGDVAHSNFVMTMSPTKKFSRQSTDINAIDGLDNAKTAEEYVTKAIKLHNQYEGGRKHIPTSSFTKYNYIEHPTPIEKEPTVEQHRQPTRHNNFHKEPEKFVEEETSYYPPKTTTQPRHHQHHQDDYNHPTNQPNHIKHLKPMPDPQINNFHQSPPVKHHIIKIIEDIPQPQSTQSAIVTSMDNDQLMSHIEQSVMKMFHEMEIQKKREEDKSYHKTFHHTTTTRVPPPTEPSPPLHQQVHHTVQHHTIKVPAKKPVDSQPAQYSTDIIVRNRPSPTTDGSNSYRHNSNFDHNSILKTAQGFDSANVMHSKPVNKLHFNQQTYHDINALPYSPEKDAHELSNGYYKKGYSYDSPHDTSGTATSVGATISFGTPTNNNHNNNNNNNLHRQQRESSEDQGYTTTGPIHIINGIPVANPYKMDLNAIRYMLDGLSQAQAYDNDQKSSTNDYDDNYQASSSSRLPKFQQHDSYSSKYNHNPKGVGYQDEQTRTPRKQQKHGSHEFHKNDGSTFRHQPQQHWNHQYDYDENDEGWHGSSGTQYTGDQYGSSTKTFQNHQSASNGKAKASPKFSKNSSNIKSNHSGSHNSSSISNSHNNKNSNYRSSKKNRDVDVEMRPPPKYIKY